MARIRSVKAELRTSLTVAEWPREVRYFWVLLWGYLDDHGRGVDEPRLIKADCFPLDDDLSADIIDEWLARFEKSGVVCRYIVGGRNYLHAVNWRQHQKPQHPNDSRIPECDGSDLLNASCKLHEVPGGVQEQFSGDGFGNTPSPTTSAIGIGEGEGDVEGTSLEDVRRLCAHLAGRIEGHGSKRPRITQEWLTHARLMLDRDGRTEQQVHAAIDWCQDDTFWQTNIMSMPTLRRQYDKIRLQAKNRNRGSPRGTHEPFRNPEDQSRYDEELRAP